MLEWVVINLVVVQVFFKVVGIRPDRRALTDEEKMIAASLVNAALVVLIPASVVLAISFDSDLVPVPEASSLSVATKSGHAKHKTTRAG